jgi:2-alkenal reductase
MRLWALAAAGAAIVALGGCGGGSSSSGQTRTATVERTVTVAAPNGAAAAPNAPFDPASIYRREAAGVVTVISVFAGSSAQDLLGGGGNGGSEGLGSGFVVSGDGDVATNAHVVTTGQGAKLQRAREVFVQFGDGNQVPARIVGTDFNADVALIHIDPGGLTLRPLPLGTTRGLVVGQPVAAIGSPFDEPQSLSVGVISALGRTIDSLDGQFGIPGAIQTDAAINHGNSGGPLVDAAGRVLGINSQIQSTGGGGEGVGFAVPIDLVKRSLAQLRAKGTATYAYLGVSTVSVYPQLAQHFGLAVKHGAWVQTITAGGPADRAHINAGRGAARPFQTESYKPGGDVIASVDGVPLRRQEDLSEVIARHAPGDTVTLDVYSGRREHAVRVRLAARPGGGSASR